MRHQHTGRPTVETGQYPGGIIRRHPHDAGNVAGTCRQQHDVGHGAIERRVLLVDHDEIVAQRAVDLGGVRGRRLDEGADKVLPR